MPSDGRPDGPSTPRQLSGTGVPAPTRPWTACRPTTSASGARRCPRHRHRRHSPTHGRRWAPSTSACCYRTRPRPPLATLLLLGVDVCPGERAARGRRCCCLTARRRLGPPTARTQRTCRTPCRRTSLPTSRTPRCWRPLTRRQRQRPSNTAQVRAACLRGALAQAPLALQPSRRAGRWQRLRMHRGCLQQRRRRAPVRRALGPQRRRARRPSRP